MPRDPGAVGMPNRKDRLGDLADCRKCGRKVRRSYHESLGLTVDLEPWPLPIDPSWAPEWAALCWSWRNRVGFCSVRFGTTTQLVYVAHPCGI